MADGKDTEAEPSIEEILDSIRQIISDDDAPAAAPPPPPPPPAPKPAPAPVPVFEPEPEEIVELTQPLEEEPVVVPQPAIKPPAAMRPAPSDDSLLSSRAQTAAYDGFSDLARKVQVEHNGVTLEDIVRTELNPLLRDWLDKHLPKIIDKLVRDELQKIARRAETDAENL